MGLPEGAYYVVSGGTQFLDARGNVYERAAETPPAVVKSPPRKRPPNPLPDQVQRYIDDAVMELVAAPAEHFVAFGLSEDGLITFHHRESSNAWNHCSVDIKRICQQLGKHTTGLIAMHNHVTGDRNMSPEDRDVTERLTAALKAYDVALIKPEVIPGETDVQASQHRVITARQPLTTWDVAEAKESRLWACYGGRRPF